MLVADLHKIFEHLTHNRQTHTHSHAHQQTNRHKQTLKQQRSRLTEHQMNIQNSLSVIRSTFYNLVSLIECTNVHKDYLDILDGVCYQTMSVFLILPSTYPLPHPSFHLSTPSSFLPSIHSFTLPSTYPLPHPSFHLSTPSPFLPPIHSLILPSTYPLPHPSFHLSTPSSFLPSIHYFIFSSIYLLSSFLLSIHSHPSFYLFIQPFIHQFYHSFISFIFSTIHPSIFAHCRPGVLLMLLSSLATGILFSLLIIISSKVWKLFSV